MNKELQRKLSKYSAAAVAVIAAGGAADAQVVYTQVNKTITPTAPVDSVDLNQDGVYDLAMVIYNLGAPDYAIIGGAINSQGHAMAGSAPSSYNYPFKLNSGVAVNTQNFLPAGSEGTFAYVVGGTSPYNEFWNDGVIDGYLGVKLDINGATHYGWVRMDITANAQQIVIKDMAYNATAGGAISTGQGIGVNDYADVANSLWVSDAILRVELNTEFTNATINVIDASGRLMETLTLSDQKQDFNLSHLASGTYIVSLKMDNVVYNKKVVF